jgi:hypothetical protein
MRCCRTVALATVLTAATAACAREIGDVGHLQRALRQEYPGAHIEVSFVNGPRQLELLVDSAAWSNYQLETSELHALGQPIARFALEHYGAAADLDSITVDFVQERSGFLFLKSSAFTRSSFAVADLR